MDKPRPCGCKGCRTCLICEKEFSIQKKTLNYVKDRDCYVYCPLCNLAWEGWDLNILDSHPNHEGKSFYIGGIFITENFLSPSEESQLVEDADKVPWSLSQSGRRKQNFGPKTNFKKRKVTCGSFEGFPQYSKYIQDRFIEIPILNNYQTIEQCFLEYDPSRGASIDPHIDDCWVWGERIITVNCLSDSVLTMTPYKGDSIKYNLCDVDLYSSCLIGKELDSNKSIKASKHSGDIIVRVPMPRRSLLVLYGESRYDWEHCVLREDIVSRRVCIAYREFTPPYLPGGTHEEVGKDTLIKASVFWETT